MKQKIIIKVQIACHKCRTKALKIAAGAPGVVSVTVQGDEALVVTGNCVDPVALTATLRKKVGVAILLSVEELKVPPKKESPAPPGGKGEKEAAPAGEKKNGGGDEKTKGKEDKPKEKQPQMEKEKPAPAPVANPTPATCCSYGMPPPSYSCPGYNSYYYPQPQPQYCMYEICPPDPNPPCSIM